MKGRVSTEEDGKGEEDGYRKEEKKEEREQDKLKEKARLDQLWASFKQDTSAQSHGPTNSNVLTHGYQDSHTLPTVLFTSSYP